MRKIADLKGKRFGRLVVKDTIRIKNKTKWLCICDCGAEKVNASFDLTSGKVKSCGCLSKERATTHGMTNTRVYRSWDDMKKRCSNPKATGYKYYGGRGIKVCDRWLVFDNFYEDMGDPPTNKHTIDRIDPDGNYEKSNCRWATRSEQQRNRRPFKQWNQFLTDEQIRDIKFSHETGRDIAKRYNISDQMVSKIRTGKRHKHITEDT